MRYLLVLIAAVFLSCTVEAQLSISLGFNVDRQPIWGPTGYDHVDFYYLPDKLCLELKSWKLYCSSFRMIGTFHETVSAYLFTTLTALLKPRWALLAGDFFPRGNVNTTLIFEKGSPRPAGADILLRQYAPRSKSFTDQSDS